jgi:AcrR family transcriptional regulator
VSAAPRSSRGRPRDPDLEERVFDAVIGVYGESGWAGFTLEAVARRARVGREALYRRWVGKAELLAGAVAARAPQLAAVDTGSTTGDLTVLVWAFVVEGALPLVTGSPHLGDRLPSGAFKALVQGGSAVPPAQAAALLLGYAVVLVGAAAVMERRREL